MKELKIYKNYGVLAAEKRKVYTYGGEHPHATCSDEITVLVPDEWELYENQMGNIMVESPWGWCYEVNDILTDINGHPVFRAMDKTGRPHIAFLYTEDELNEKKRKEEKKRKMKMKKQFETKDALLQWIMEKFPEEEKEWSFENIEESLASEYPNPADVAAKLVEEGYDLDDLTANGEGYQINGHTNNGWFWADKEDLAWLDVGTDMSKVRIRK